MNLTAGDELLARAVGWEIMTCLKREQVWEKLVQAAEGDAVRILDQIRRVLDDDSLDDPECFEKIEKIVQVFYANGLNTGRHDWG